MSKYNSSRIEIDGFVFDSKLESEYYLYLQGRLKRNEIKGFILQPTYELTPKYIKNGVNVRATTYTPDFLIRHLDDSVEAIDIKGFPTQASELKKKWFGYKYPTIKLTWVSYVKKYGGWIDTDELKRVRKENKKVV